MGWLTVLICSTLRASPLYPRSLLTPFAVAVDLSLIKDSKLWERMQHGEDGLEWAVLTPSTEGKGVKLFVSAVGDTPLDDLKTRLVEDALLYVVLRVTGDKTHSRLCIFSWMGPHVPFRAKSASREVSAQVVGQLVTCASSK